MRKEDHGAPFGASVSVAGACNRQPGQHIAAANKAIDADRGKRLAGQLGFSPITVLIASIRERLSGTQVRQLAEEQGIRVVEERVVASGLLLPSLKQHLPDLLLLDKSIFDELGSRSLGQVRARFPGLRVLLVLEEICPGLPEEILRNHICGFVLSSCPPEAFLKAVRAVVIQGELWLPRALLGKALCQLMQGWSFAETKVTVDRMRGEAGSGLTLRETQIVEFLRQGQTNKEIACRLGIMEDTVKKHLQSVFGKLGVRRRALVALNRPPRQTTIA